MTIDSLVNAAAGNLKQTYLQLGRASAQSQVWEERGFAACTGKFEHPICNFAVDLRLDPRSAFRLAEIAIERPAFHVYGLPTDEPRNRNDLLEHAGFCRSYALVKMIAEAAEQTPKRTMKRAATMHDRKEIATFMVEQFFSRQSPQFRRHIADTTARATSLELLGLRKDGRLLGAAMICVHEGVAGVYNLCVDSGLRGLGIGTSILREILSVCYEKRMAATLQCDAKLESWYSRCGFKRAGELEVFALPKPSGFVIMQQA